MQTALPRHRQRTQDLCAALTEKARLLGPDAKMPTVVELCHEFKASSRTLNHALQELEQRGVLYRVRAVGIFVSPTLRPNVALVIDPVVFRGVLHSPFWDLLARRAEERAAAKGENFSFHFTLPPSPNQQSAPIHVGLVHAIENRQVDGIIAVNLNRDAVTWLEAQDVPLVAFASPAQYLVEHDNDAMVRMGVRALQRRGCRRVAMWIPTHKGNVEFREFAQSAARQARDAFRTALEEAGLEFEPGLVHDHRSLLNDERLTAFPSEREQGYETAHAVFAAGETRPDGILIVNDLMTFGAMKALEKLGLEVGRDVQIATLTNAGSPVLTDYEDRLIRLEFDAQEVTAELFAMLETLMRGETIVQPLVKIAPHLRDAGN